MTFHSNWFDSNIQNWKRLLKPFKNRPNLLFLEIGCYEGRSTLWLLANILTSPSSKIEVVDTFRGSIENNKGIDVIRSLYSTFKENLSRYISEDVNKNKVIIHKGESGIELRKMGTVGKYDFIYVDGSHQAKNVLEDAILSWRLLKKNGIMIFDDYGWKWGTDPLLRPEMAINSFLRVFHGQYKVLYTGFQVAIQKKHYGGPEKIPGIYEEAYLERRIENLSKDLERIQSAKTYIIWQRFCGIRDKVRLLLKRVV